VYRECLRVSSRGRPKLHGSRYTNPTTGTVTRHGDAFGAVARARRWPTSRDVAGDHPERRRAAPLWAVAALRGAGGNFYTSLKLVSRRSRWECARQGQQCAVLAHEDTAVKARHGGYVDLTSRVVPSRSTAQAPTSRASRTRFPRWMGQSPCSASKAGRHGASGRGTVGCRASVTAARALLRMPPISGTQPDSRCGQRCGRMPHRRVDRGPPAPT
jgi:hypothetical protein